MAITYKAGNRLTGVSTGGTDNGVVEKVELAYEDDFLTYANQTTANAAWNLQVMEQGIESI